MRSPSLLGLRTLHPRHWNLRLLWDLFMVWVALVNLGMILFDLTYLLLRPTYFRYTRVVTTVYDRVKGIEPHPLTDELLEEATQARDLLALDPASPGLAERVARLRELSLRVLEENPFERSGQTHNLEILKVMVGQQVGASTRELGRADALAAAVERFWSREPAALARSLQLFDARMRPLLEVNYFREFDLDGKLVDHFWLLDLPFLSLFIVEFGVRWSLAVRRRTYPRWFFFPLFNWYDLIGLMPHTQLRLFRLFRVAAIYMRLRRSEVSRVGKDVLSRAVAYVSNIIAEEISDAVALRILNETQDEIRDGTHLRIWDRAVASRRGKIEEAVVREVRAVVANPATQERMRELLRVNLETALERSEALRAVPLPDALVRPLVLSLGKAVTDTTLDTVVATLGSEEGERAARDLVATVMDQVLEGPGREIVASLGEEISLDVIENMKAAVAVKKWALPERRPRSSEPQLGVGDDRA